MNRPDRFAIRGVIEGFYGTPWSHAERLDMIGFLKRHGFNAYFYAPKDAPFLRERWHEPHPSEEFARIGELIAAAGRAGIAFYYCLSPGLNMQYTSEAHLEQLTAKYRQVWEQGARHFGLLLDDIPPVLMHASDRERYNHLAEAHADLIDKVWTSLREWSEEARLIVCPTLYCGSGNEPYIRYLARRLPTDVALFWTGRFVCSPSLTEGDAIRFEQETGRRPLYWDNYPVNDLKMANELHIGPLMHRDPQLYRHASGYAANAMASAESSKIPLITIADYLNDPEGYDPEASWRRAVEEVAGSADLEPFLRFADNVRGSFLNDRESPQLMDVLHQFRFDFLHGDADHAVDALGREFQQMEQTASYLLHRMHNQKLAAEVRPWVWKYWHWAKVGQSAVAMIAEGRRGRTIQALFHLLKLKQRLKKAERLPQKVAGHVMNLFVDAVLREVQTR